MAESEAIRLERLWAGQFGDEYIERNLRAAPGRERFWSGLFARHPVRRVLEVGCNTGANLRWICRLIPPGNVYGVDINIRALRRMRAILPGLNAVRARALALPFHDGSFDLVFTTGVLIHQPSEALPEVIAEIVRCSRRYVLCGEYYAPVPTEVPYRGQHGALFKRDFGAMYHELFPELCLVTTGFLAREDGAWDDVTYWLFEKASPVAVLA